MGRYLLRRLFQAFPVLLGITLISFLIVNSAPGDPALLYMDRSSNPTQEDIARVRQELGLDKPLPMRYVDWVSRAVTGDFGNSFADKRPVMTKIAEAIPYSLTLAAVSLVIGYGLAILLGVLAAVKANTWVDYLISGVSALFVSLPSFWVALMMILIFSLKLKLFPVYGWSDIDNDSFLNVAWHLTLPALMLASRDIAGLSRYVRSGMIEMLNADFIRTARAKGMEQKVIIFKHALRNAMVPVITVMGLSLPHLVGGAVVTEKVFALPGMGRLAVDAVSGRDYPVIIAINLLLSVMVVFGNMLADLMYGLVDPRIRYA